ncbi:MAG: DUF4398 domain-containing protein [Lysobacteraceae bacterium]
MTGNGRNNRQRGKAGLAVLIAAGLVACASTPPPTSALDAADAAIVQARSAQAADHAPVELGFAESKRAQATAAVNNRDNALARTLALQAEADAELALAKSRAATARAEVQRRSSENTNLRRELLGEGDLP